MKRGRSAALTSRIGNMAPDQIGNAGFWTWLGANLFRLAVLRQTRDYRKLPCRTLNKTFVIIKKIKNNDTYFLIHIFDYPKCQ
jgi:hypothetical protein